MVKTKIIHHMNRILLSCALILSLNISSQGQEYTWSGDVMDGHRTACTTPSKANVKETVGYFKGKTYVAPNGKTFPAGSATAKVARIVLDSQPAMARVKDVIAYSTESMSKKWPESPLSNWVVDLLMQQGEKHFGKKVDIGITNFGGIRVDMPKGDVILDDMLSMFPFKNQLVYVEHKGSTIRKILEGMLPYNIQVLGGLRIVIEDGKLTSVNVGNEPLDDEKVYGLLTISFLLNGGDNLRLADDALNIIPSDVDVKDAVLAHVYAETAAGRPIESSIDNRVIIRQHHK